MILWIWKKDDATGLLDNEYKKGDVYQADRDDIVPNLGSKEKELWLIIKTEDPPIGVFDKMIEEFKRCEYQPTANPDENIVRHKRIRFVDWESRMTEDEIEIASDLTQPLPEGPFAGGEVVAGVLEGVFTLKDVLRK